MKLFLKHLFLVAILLLLCSDTRAQLQTQQFHDSLGGRVNSESDRFLALFYLAQCERELADLWIHRAIEHDPTNSDAHRTRAMIYPWVKQESMRLYQKGKERGELYYFREAIICDPSNMLARNEIARIMREASGNKR